MFASARILLIGNISGSAVLFLRNLLLARLIGVEDYGVATTFAMVMTVVEMASQLGLQQMIIQDDQGDDPALQAGLQALHLLRSVLSAIVLFLAAGPIAGFLNIPEVAWAFQVLALPRLADGFVHFDIYRLQRRQRFWPLMITENTSFIAGFAFVAGFSWWFGDYRLMLYSFVVQYLLKSIASHVVAERKYRLALDLPLMSRCFSFGWPLLLNGAVVFLVINGEKVVVARELGVGLLALYAMGLTLAMTPGLVLTRSTASFFLPLLAARKHDPESFRLTAMALIQAMILAGLILIVGTMLVTVNLVPVLLGNDFLGVIALLTPMAIQYSIRMIQAGVSQCSIAQGKTRNALVANLCRISVLPLVWYAATNGASLTMLVGLAILGETLGLVAGLLLLRRVLRVSLRPLLPSLSLTFVLFGWLAVRGIWDFGNGSGGLVPLIVFVVSVGLFVSTLASLRWLRQFVRQQRTGAAG